MEGAQQCMTLKQEKTLPGYIHLILKTHPYISYNLLQNFPEQILHKEVRFKNINASIGNLHIIHHQSRKQDNI